MLLLSVGVCMALGSALLVRYWLWPGLAELLNDPIRLAQSTAPYLEKEGLRLEIRDARAEWTQWLAPRLSIGQIRLTQVQDQTEVFLAESVAADFGLRSLLSPIYGLPIFSQLRSTNLRIHARRDNATSVVLAGFRSNPAAEPDPSDSGREVYKVLSLQGPWAIHQAQLLWQDKSHPTAREGQLTLDDLTLTLTDDALALETLAVSAQELSALVGRVVPLPALEGQIGPLRLQWRGDITEAPSLSAAEQIERLRLDVQFQGIGLSPEAIAARQPGISGLSGRLLLSSQQGSLALRSTDLTVHLPGHLPGGFLQLDAVNGEIEFSAQELASSLVENQTGAIALNLGVEQLSLRRGDLTLETSGRYRYAAGKTAEGHVGSASLGAIEAQGTLAGLVPTALNDLLPLTMKPGTRAWLIRSIEAGRPVRGDFTISGALSDFPYRDPNTGNFAVRLRLEDQTLAFDPLWPKISGAFVDLTFDRSRLLIESRQARIGSAPITQLRAEVADLGAAVPVLQLKGEVAGPLAQMVDTVNQSPIREWLGKALINTTTQGLARLSLGLQLNLDRGHASTVEGQLTFQDNRVTLDKDIPEMTGVRGSLMFNEKGLSRLAVSGRVLGGPFAVTPASPRTSPVRRLAVRGELAASPLESWLRRSAGIPLSPGVLSGKAPFGLTIDLGREGIEVIGQSSLRGLAIRLPVPARKRSEEDWGLQWSLLQKTDDSGQRSQTWKVSTVSQQLSAEIQRSEATASESSRLYGRVGLGTPVSNAAKGTNVNTASIGSPNTGSRTPGIVLQVVSESLDLSAWIDALETRFTSGTSTSDSKARQSSRPSTGAAPDQGLARIEVQAQQVVLGGQRISGVQAKAANQSGVWRVDLESAQVSGQLAWTPNRPAYASGILVARLQRLWLPPGQATAPPGPAAAVGTAPRTPSSVEAAALVSSDDTLPSRPLTALSESRRWPTIDLIAEDFRRGNKPFGRLVLDASPAPDQARWDIRGLTLENPQGRLTATGQWAALESDGKTPAATGSSRTRLDLRLEVIDGSGLLDRLGYPGLIRGTPGTLSGQIQWAGAPTDFELGTLEGKLSLDLRNGQFLKADAGLAKLISVVNLQSLPKRITLDFRDIFSEGFVYERVRGTVGFAQGRATTDNLRIVGIQASVFLEGAANLLDETQDLHVLVLPELNAGLASLGYALVNPAVGLGSFIAQYILRDPLRQALAYEYKVTGAWDDPQVAALPRRAVSRDNPDSTPQAPASPPTSRSR
ncbi:MAG: hypothetical protein RLZZ344_51 [Pseudomonadota bacterium]